MYFCMGWAARCVMCVGEVYGPKHNSSSRSTRTLRKTTRADNFEKYFDFAQSKLIYPLYWDLVCFWLLILASFGSPSGSVAFLRLWVRFCCLLVVSASMSPFVVPSAVSTAAFFHCDD